MNLSSLTVGTVQNIPDNGHCDQSYYHGTNIFSQHGVHAHRTCHLEAYDEVGDAFVHQVLKIQLRVIPLPVLAYVAQVHKASELD